MDDKTQGAGSKSSQKPKDEKPPAAAAAVTAPKAQAKSGPKPPRYFVAKGKLLKHKRGLLKAGDEIREADFPPEQRGELVAKGFLVAR